MVYNQGRQIKGGSMKRLVLFVLLGLAFTMLFAQEERNHEESRKNKARWYHVFFPTGITFNALLNDMSEINDIAESVGAEEFYGSMGYSFNIDYQIDLGKDYFLWLMYTLNDGLDTGYKVYKLEDGSKSKRRIQYLMNTSSAGFGRNFPMNSNKYILAPSLMTGFATEYLTIHRLDTQVDWNDLGNPPTNNLNSTVPLQRMSLFLQPRLDAIFPLTSDLAMSFGIGYNFGFPQEKWTTLDETEVKNAPKTSISGVTISLGFRLM